LVPMHYLFFWRYAAGAAAVVFAYVTFKVCVGAWRNPSTDTLAPSLFLLMSAAGGTTHMLVKIRPMKTTPLLGYHTLVGVMGISLLIAYGLMRIGRDWPRSRSAAAIA